jgi:hypothetical protein
VTQWNLPDLRHDDEGCSNGLSALARVGKLATVLGKGVDAERGANVGGRLRLGVLDLNAGCVRNPVYGVERGHNGGGIDPRASRSGNVPSPSCRPLMPYGETASLRREHSTHLDAWRVSAAMARRVLPSNHAPARAIRFQAWSCAAMMSART